jgi:hypothetical protein
MIKFFWISKIIINFCNKIIINSYYSDDFIIILLYL